MSEHDWKAMNFTRFLDPSPQFIEGPVRENRTYIYTCCIVQELMVGTELEKWTEM